MFPQKSKLNTEFTNQQFSVKSRLSWTYAKKEHRFMCVLYDMVSNYHIC